MTICLLTSRKMEHKGHHLPDFLSGLLELRMAMSMTGHAHLHSHSLLASVSPYVNLTCFLQAFPIAANIHFELFSHQELDTQHFGYLDTYFL